MEIGDYILICYSLVVNYSDHVAFFTIKVTVGLLYHFAQSLRFLSVFVVNYTDYNLISSL